jgi:hypothetical protein
LVAQKNQKLKKERKKEKKKDIYNNSYFIVIRIILLYGTGPQEIGQSCSHVGKSDQDIGYDYMT